MNLFNLAGRVGIVTGAGNLLGIGHSTTKKLAQAGLKAIYVTDIREDNFSRIKDSLKELAPECAVITTTLDVTSEDATRELCKRVIREQGRLDVYMANAGLVDMNSLWNTQVADFTKLTNTMVVGPFLGIKYGARAMSVLSQDKKQPEGSIIITGSIASVSGGVASAAYTAAKHASLGLARRSAIELANTQIRVNVLAPGFTSTHLWDTSRELGTVRGDAPPGRPLNAQSPRSRTDYIKQVSHPDDIASVALFLASDLSRAVNAEIIMADRGHLQQADMSWGTQATYGGIEPPDPLELD